MSQTQHDVAVIGGGIVGAATALALVGKKSVALLEAESEPGLHQSGRNSGVIHSGLYYRPDSEKARLCLAGREKLYGFCAEHGIPHARCGKLVVATSDEEVPALDSLERRGRENGLGGLRRLGRAEIAEREPHAAGVAALLVPETGVVDYGEVTRVIVRLFEQRGGRFLAAHRLHGVRPESAGLGLDTAGGTVRAKLLVNCAGLQADRVAQLCGHRPEVRIVPFRGEYYELVDDRRDLVRHLIYPVPDPRLPFLGVHLTRRVDDRVEAGPNAVLAWNREGYGRFRMRPRDVASVLAWPGSWKLGLRFWKTGLAEKRRSLSKRAFVTSLKRLVPELVLADVRPAGCGIRAQAVDRRGNLVDDFVFIEHERQIHVLNAPSPAATASLAIGEAIAQRVMRLSYGIVSSFLILSALAVGPSWAQTPQRRPLRVVTYNIHGFHPMARTDEGKARVRKVVSASQVPRRLALELLLQQPDIISLQEAASEKRVAELARHLGMRFAYFPGGWKGKGWPEGISGAVLTRLEIVESQNCPPYADEERPNDIYSRHSGRVLLRSGKQEIAVFSAHLLPSWANTTHIRKQEIAGIVKMMELDRKKGRSVLVLGDMNHTPGTPEYEAWTAANLVDTLTKGGTGEKNTCPSDVPTERIDYIWATGPIAKRLKSARVLFVGAFRTNPHDPGSFALSDHLPVLAVFE